MNLSSEAGPQRLHGGVAQPQNSMKESLTDMTLLLIIDHTAQSSRASSKSTSLALLLHLHANVGAVVRQRTDGGSSPGRPRCAPSSGLPWHTAMGIGCVPLKSGSSAEQVVSVGGCPERRRDFRPHPVTHSADLSLYAT